MFLDINIILIMEYIQHDALEFFRYLLEDISMELNENKELQPYKEITV